MKFSHLLTLAFVASLIVSGGCRTMEFKGPNWVNQKERPRLRVELPFQKKKEEVAGTPQKMAVIWKDTTLQTPGNPVVRGFGGRVFFYDEENKPIKVDGEMVVYGFNTDGGSIQADKKFVFKREKLDEHYGETDMGHSYSFWIPWDRLGNERTSVTLIPAFKSTDGKLVKGGQTINVLPGPAPREPELKTSTYRGSEIELTSGNNTGSVQQASHSVQQQSGIRETTIRLPKHLGNRIAQLPGNVTDFNVVSVKQEAVQVLDKDGQVVDRNKRSQVEQERREEKHSPEKRERKPFGMPASFN